MDGLCSTHRVEKSKHLGDFGVDGMIILKTILNKLSVSMWAAFVWLWIGFGDEFFLPR